MFIKRKISTNGYRNYAGIFERLILLHFISNVLFEGGQIMKQKKFKICKSEFLEETKEVKNTYEPKENSISVKKAFSLKNKVNNKSFKLTVITNIT